MNKLQSNWKMVESCGGFKKSKKGGSFVSKTSRARKRFSRHAEPSETLSNLAQLRERRAAVDKIPHDQIKWGHKQDGSGVWFKKRNEKGHIKTYFIAY